MAEKAFDAMEFIWDRLPKEKDGQHIRYLKGDLPYLYFNGFVDTEKFTLNQWQDSFLAYEQEDGSFLLNKRQFMILRIFRYIAPSYEPFDPKKLRRGPWPDKELQYLYEKSVKPSSRIPEEVYWASIKALKSSGHANDKGELDVNDSVIKQLEYLIDKFPSPRRKLEKEVTRIRQEKEKHLNQHQENRNATTFAVGETERDHKLAEFQKMQSTAKEVSSQKAVTNKPEIDLKSLRKGGRPGGKIVG